MIREVVAFVRSVIDTCAESNRMTDALERLDAVVQRRHWESYRRAGFPFGKSHQGLMLWQCAMRIDELERETHALYAERDAAQERARAWKLAAKIERDYAVLYRQRWWLRRQYSDVLEASDGH